MFMSNGINIEINVEEDHCKFSLWGWLGFIAVIYETNYI